MVFALVVTSAGAYKVSFSAHSHACKATKFQVMAAKSFMLMMPRKSTAMLSKPTVKKWHELPGHIYKLQSLQS